MRQLLMNMDGVVVARMPRPSIQRGMVLIRVHYSLISVGTEVAPLRPASVSAPDVSPIERHVERARLARHYLRASLRDPRKAARRVSQMAERRLSRLRQTPQPGGADAAAAPTTSDRNAQGWAIGYSVAGEVVAVGEGISDLAAGDLVAAAGAGQANHAEYVSVARNLVCRVPAGCDLKHAASATIGAIALQGVRRAAPQLRDRAAVIGLGLIGQITVQLLAAAGCRVIGFDLDAERVSRALGLGLHAGAGGADHVKLLVRDLTEGHGADCTIMTAATKSNAVINLAMELTRARGRVVIVGDIGLNVDRAVFYRKEIDLLMSTSYGPGRYDPAYESEGHDYPYGHVRWTLNRNMQAYLELVAAGQVRVDPLLDRVVQVQDAPAAYDQLARAEGAVPLGVVIEYPQEGPVEDEQPARVTMGGRRQPGPSRIAYALVGAGSFGTAMLVPPIATSSAVWSAAAPRAAISRATSRWRCWPAISMRCSAILTFS
jgi:threonine dehydrogenase-like Zn-dependent dehydrogenase